MGTLMNAVDAYQSGKEWRQRQDEYKYQLGEREEIKKRNIEQDRLLTAMLSGELKGDALAGINPKAYMEAKNFLTKEKQQQWEDEDREFNKKKQQWAIEDRDYNKEEMDYNRASRPDAEQTKALTDAEYMVKSEHQRIKGVSDAANVLKKMDGNPNRQKKYLIDRIAQLEKYGKNTDHSKYALSLLESGDIDKFNTVLDESINLNDLITAQNAGKSKGSKSYAPQLIETETGNQLAFPSVDANGNPIIKYIDLKGNKLTRAQMEELKVTTAQQKILNKNRIEKTNEFSDDKAKASDAMVQMRVLLDQLGELNTGYGFDIVTGMKKIFNKNVANEEAARAAIEQTLLDRTEVLSGVLTDTDMAIIRRSLASVYNTPEGNYKIISDQMNKLEHIIGVSDLFSDHVDKGGDPLTFTSPTVMIDMYGEPRDEQHKDLFKKYLTREEQRRQEIIKRENQKQGQAQQAKQNEAQQNPSNFVPPDLKNTQTQITTMQDELGGGQIINDQAVKDLIDSYSVEELQAMLEAEENKSQGAE